MTFLKCIQHSPHVLNSVRTSLSQQHEGATDAIEMYSSYQTVAKSKESRRYYYSLWKLLISSRNCALL